MEHQDKPLAAFQKYIDALLDLIAPPPPPSNPAPAPIDGVPPSGAERDVLFMGPDEGTAEFMDWASLHARSRLKIFNKLSL